MTLFVVQATGTDDAALVRARFIADRFSWPAFAFSWLWLLYRGLWLTLLVWIIVEIVVLVLAFATPYMPLTVVLAVDLLARIALGLEAHRLRLDKGARQAVLTELVEARDRDEAEAIFYSRHRPDAPELPA